jgi:hypothetical protein
MRPNDFASYLLAIGICNLLLYFAFYIIMKVSEQDQATCQPPCFVGTGHSSPMHQGEETSSVHLSMPVRSEEEGQSLLHVPSGVIC